MISCALINYIVLGGSEETSGGGGKRNVTCLRIPIFCGWPNLFYSIVSVLNNSCHFLSYVVIFPSSTDVFFKSAFFL